MKISSCKIEMKKNIFVSQTVSIFFSIDFRKSLYITDNLHMNAPSHFTFRVAKY